MTENLWQLFLKGGGFMWPILVLSILATILILERAIYFLARSYRVGPTLQKIKPNITSPNGLAVSNNPLLKLALTYLEGHSQGQDHLNNVTQREASRLIKRHERGLRSLSTIGSISPLVGLLGTVWGMVQAFAAIATIGDSVRPADLADGIWTGLLTTVAGLVVAIPAVAATRFFESKVDRLTHDLNEVVSHLDEWTSQSS